MSRMPVVIATTAALLLGLASPTQAADPAAPAKASAEIRATYDRMDALSRSVFWANEQQVDPNDPVAGVKLSQALRELGKYDQAAQAAAIRSTASTSTPSGAASRARPRSGRALSRSNK